MKSVIKSLLKFNALLIALIIALIVVAVGFDIKGPNMKMATILVLLFAWLVIGNLKILYKSRKEIVESFKSGSIEIAASAIEFKEKANARAIERMKEKQEK